MWQSRKKKVKSEKIKVKVSVDSGCYSQLLVAKGYLIRSGLMYLTRSASL
jgi:hypothetical protein